MGHLNIHGVENAIEEKKKEPILCPGFLLAAIFSKLLLVLYPQNNFLNLKKNISVT